MSSRASRRSRTSPVAAVVFVTLVVTAGCGGGATSPSASPPPVSPTASPAGVPSPSVEPDAPYAGAEAVIRVGGGPRGVAAFAGSIWVASTIGNKVQRIDPSENAVIAEIRLIRPVTLVTIDDQLWVSVLNRDPEGDDEVVRIDPATDTVELRARVPVFHNIAAGAGSIWAIDAAGELRRIDPATGEVTAAASVGGKSIGIAANDAAVWGIRGDGVAWRVPARGGDLLEAPMGVLVPGRSRVGVASGAGDVWVAVPGTVLALDPDTLTARVTLSVPGMTLVNDLWVTETDVWLSANLTDPELDLDGGAVLRLDPATADILDVYPLGPESSGLVVADGSLWAVDQRDNVLVRYALAGQT